MKKLIKNYIDKLTENDIEMFAIKNNISLNEEEIKIIYFYIKNDYETLLWKDSTPIFDKLKTKIRKDNYEAIFLLYQTYKEKYKNYL